MKNVTALLLLLLASCGGAQKSALPVQEAGDNDPKAACVLPDNASPRCITGDDCIACAFERLTLASGSRRIQYQVPEGNPPSAGWPVVILFQGTGYGGDIMWSSEKNEPFGMFHETQLIAALLAADYAVLTPETIGGGKTFWQTNVLDQWDQWETTVDHEMMLGLLAAIADGDFGSLNPAQLRAAGISSGGFMTSRMAVSYPGKFRALAIQSAGYATYPLGPIPVTLPADHPPTLFLHGAQDVLVSPDAMTEYYDRLAALGIVTRKIVADVGHQYLPTAPGDVTAWFQAH